LKNNPDAVLNDIDGVSTTGTVSEATQQPTDAVTADESVVNQHEKWRDVLQVGGTLFGFLIH